MAEESREATSNPEPPKIRISGAAKPPTGPIRISATASQVQSKKSETSRINLNSATPPPPAAPPTSIRITPESVKKSTSRIAVPTPLKVVDPAEDTAEAEKKTTVRVQLEDLKKHNAAQGGAMRITASESIPSKQRTTQIKLNELIGGDESPKQRTTAIEVGKPAGGPPTSSVPRTIRIKQPEVTPTAVLRKSPAETAPTLEAMPNLDVPRKSETARIELPPSVEAEQPPTRRKTIKIKRPDGGGGTSRPLVISQSRQEQIEPDLKIDEDEPGAVFFAVALLSVLVTIGLVTVQALTLRSFMQY